MRTSFEMLSYIKLIVTRTHPSNEQIISTSDIFNHNENRLTDSSTNFEEVIFRETIDVTTFFLSQFSALNILKLQYWKFRKSLIKVFSSCYFYCERLFILYVFKKLLILRYFAYRGDPR